MARLLWTPKTVFSMESLETKTHTQCTMLTFGDSMTAFSSLGFIRRQAGSSIRMLTEEYCEAVLGDLSFVPPNSIKEWMNTKLFWWWDDSVRHETGPEIGRVEYNEAINPRVFPVADEKCVRYLKRRMRSNIRTLYDANPVAD
jgi:hypothetical protein